MSEANSIMTGLLTGEESSIRRSLLSSAIQNQASMISRHGCFIESEHDKNTVIPGMEPTGHYWFNLGKFLQANAMRPVLMNPHHVKKSKELDDKDPTKNDRKDQKVIAGLIKDGCYSHTYLPDGTYTDLRTASNYRSWQV